MRILPDRLFHDETRCELDWDAGTYTIYYVTGGNSGPIWMSDLEDMLPDDLVEWLPER